ncbi:YheV family putative metal-binding protein [Alcanivorax sp. 1008]|uniref:YheV family putative metal-binding protein n=1 Tax=Alcanivorax sp. 1008 TaxID=2816853 RepID=UPI001D5D7AD9|nr:YheV family putative metal-binding protein [Alcanivorax sp. 1008]
MIKRRFIAGATCPQCGAMDKIVRVEQGDRIYMECIACNMERNLDEAPPRDHPTDEPMLGQPVTIRPLKK